MAVVYDTDLFPELYHHLSSFHVLLLSLDCELSKGSKYLPLLICPVASSTLHGRGGTAFHSASSYYKLGQVLYSCLPAYLLMQQLQTGAGAIILTLQMRTLRLRGLTDEVPSGRVAELGCKAAPV